MTEAKTPFATAPPVKLEAKDVGKQTRALYKRLFVRSILVAGLVFGFVNVLDLVSAPKGFGELLLLPLTFGGYALVEGSLVQLVRGLHEDGDHRSSLPVVFRSAVARLRPLVAASVITGFGVGVGTLLLIVPGLVLLTRWAVAVPVVMLEGLPARAALARSRALVRGNGRAVLNVLLSVGLLTGSVSLLFVRSGGITGCSVCGSPTPSPRC